MNNYFPDISIFACGISKNVLICDLVILAIITTFMAMFILSHIFLFIKKIVKKESIEKIFIIDGRLSRSDFRIWNIVLFLQLIIILFVGDFNCQYPYTGRIKIWIDLTDITLLISHVFLTILTIKRAHDCNIPGIIIFITSSLTILMGFVLSVVVNTDSTILGFLSSIPWSVFVVHVVHLIFEIGSKESNKYGENPRTKNQKKNYLKFAGIFYAIAYLFVIILIINNIFSEY